MANFNKAIFNGQSAFDFLFIYTLVKLPDTCVRDISHYDDGGHDDDKP